ncbi:MAG: 50S ribosomal protein L10 [Patescibacteria group bacterium]
MALSRTDKEQIIKELAELFESSKMTVVANYEGMTVAQMQAFRRKAEETGSTIKVVKNRLVIKALEGDDRLKDVDKSLLNNMLLYVFNDQDEVAGPQTVKSFVKEAEAPLEFIGGITVEGEFMPAEDVSRLADLPSKSELIAGVVNILQSPAKNVVSAVNGKLPAVLQAIEASKS